MRAWPWAAIALVLAAAFGFFGARALDSASQRRTAAHADSLVARWQDAAEVATRDALVAQASAHQQARRADSLLAAEQADHVARLAAEHARQLTATALSDAQTALDSLGVYPVLVDGLEGETVALRAELAHSDSVGLAIRSAYQSQVQASAILTAQLTRDASTIMALRATIAHERVPVPVQPFPAKLGRAVETAALGFVAVHACGDHLISLQCGIAAAVTLRRVF